MKTFKIGKTQQLLCCLWIFLFHKVYLYRSMHHFAELPSGATAHVYLGIIHQSFPAAGISRAGGKRGEGGGGVPAVPPLWPLTAPSNERRHSHTDVLPPCSSPFSPFLLPSSPFLLSVNPSCAPGSAFVSSLASTPLLPSRSLLFHPSQDPSPPASRTSLSAAVFSSLTALSSFTLSTLCRKRLLKRHFYWSL